MERDKYIKLAKKIKALAEKGIDGEKENAQQKLDLLMNKHNISHDDIEGVEILNYFFNVKKNDFPLWYQLVKRINESIRTYGAFPIKKIKALQLKGNYMISCTPVEYIEIEAKFEFYLKLYTKELDIFTTAFYSANDLLIDNPDAVNNLSEEELKNARRANDMAKNIKKGEFMRRLSN